MRNLVIVESPSKAKTIEKYLGKGYKVMATVGHVIDLPKNKLGVDVENSYKPDFITIRGKGSIIKKLKKEIPQDKAGKVYLAMDPDREGEAIAWHVSQALKLSSPKRIVFHEITKTAVQDALKTPRDLDKKLVDAQIARRVLDRLVGYKVSELVWRKIWYGLSAGRVQSAALRLIVEREREIEEFIPVEYWDISALAENEKTSFSSQLVNIGGKKHKICSEKEANSIHSDLEGETLKVSEINKKRISKGSYPPFTTSTMQQSANNRYGFTAKRTMGLAQALYQAGYITYMRTDSVNLSAQAIDSMRKKISEQFGDKYLPDRPRYFKNKSRNAQEAHEAIRPTDLGVEPGYISKQMGSSEAKLYELIYNRALSSQMSNRESEVISASLVAVGKSGTEYTFRMSAEKLLFDGFRKVLIVKSKDQEEELQQVESLKEGESFDIKEILTQQNFTKPKARYTEASLVKALEKLGIGRPSTYATIISTVQSRGYVERQGRNLSPLDVGRVVNDFLCKNFSRLVNYEYTAGVEEKLDMIAEDKVDYVPFIDQEYKPLIKELEVADKNVNKEDVVILGSSEEKCGDCGSEMVVRLGRYGKFLSCKRFPECKGIKNIDGGEDNLDYDKYLKPEACPKCGGKLILKTGKYGKFWACEKYPKCKGTVPMLLNKNCPDCGKPLVERRSKWGKMFVGCSGYPDCKFIEKNKKKD